MALHEATVALPEPREVPVNVRDAANAVALNQRLAFLGSHQDAAVRPGLNYLKQRCS